MINPLRWLMDTIAQATGDGFVGVASVYLGVAIALLVVVHLSER